MLLQIFKVVPHITDAIQEWIERVAAIPVDGQEGSADVCVIELGGTIGKFAALLQCAPKWVIFPFFVWFKTNLLLAGDIESMPFIEALGQFSYRVGKFVYVINTQINKLV